MLHTMMEIQFKYSGGEKVAEFSYKTDENVKLATGECILFTVILFILFLVDILTFWYLALMQFFCCFLNTKIWVSHIGFLEKILTNWNGILRFFCKWNTSFIANKYIICGISLSFAAVHISYEHGHWVLVEYDGKLFPREITHVINNQYQV